jgi:hypothetical protein
MKADNLDYLICDEGIKKDLMSKSKKIKFAQGKHRGKGIEPTSAG